MKQIKKILGIIWIILALVIAYFGVTILGIEKFKTGVQDDLIFGIIVVAILLPIIVGGLVMFGVYALQNEYAEN